MAPAKSKRSRNRAPSKADWDRIREPFNQLYYRKELPLPEVAKILAKEYNFVAGLSMYKTRLKQRQLGTRKYFKKGELAPVAKILQIFALAGLRTPTAVLDGHEVPTRRVTRHFRSLLAHNTMRDSTTARPSPERACLHILKTFQDRNYDAKAERRHGQVTMTKIFLKQSQDMHDLEFALIQVNNYYSWRLHQSDDYFLLQTVNASQCAHSNVLDPVQFFNAVTDAIFACQGRDLHTSRAAMGYIRRQAPIVLQGQHPTLLERLIYECIRLENPHSSRLRCGVYSFLLSVARTILQESHPVSMILKVLHSPETEQMSALLLLEMMCDVARRQEEHDSELVLVFEFDIARAITKHEDFNTAMECWYRLLQGSVDTLGEKHVFCREVLYQIGYVHYRHEFNNQARKFWLQVLELDDALTQGGNDVAIITIDAIECLGWICEKSEDFSGAEEWYLKAYNAACHHWGPEDTTTLTYLHELNRMRATLGGSENVSRVDHASDEDVFENLQMEIDRLQLRVEGSENLELHAEPWNEWDNDVVGAKNNTNSLNRRTTDVATPTSQTPGQDGHQNRRVEFADANNRTSHDSGPFWDVTNDLGSRTDHGPSKPTQPLEGLALDETGLMSPFSTGVYGLGNDTLGAFMPEKPSLPSLLPASGQGLITALPYIETLPTLMDDPEFQECDDAENTGGDFAAIDPMTLDPEFQEFVNTGNTGDAFDTDPMFLDFDGDFNFSTLDTEFSDGRDLQMYHAIEGQDQYEEQDFFAL
ncbi:uncharacterized protein Z520_04042 [Fonsecaea multimorphosa CBS 102226]|uniref:Clr5 domain-containing protein n=1 Tax=Fonsecaea multimorphosa CBS 102226 TaxID=1442371 RepID=A0A0D2ITR8_9EURO|nr:uncharacterized protein Z520_04042 [Fonsecaea multimorphosa CBS 102226]KIY00357.1 hypothetical protein Z520_04042 [Fonsecaea multimorphosa CBS 102226]OAL27189.1 hypothetical protein AYO22_03820 [Fonsecaea multimorphosa]